MGHTVEVKQLQESFNEASKKFVQDMVAKISKENNLKTVDSEKEKEEEFKKARQKWIESRNKK